MANHVDHQRIEDLTANAAKALRRSQALRRWGQRLTVVSCAAAVLAFVISASALWHRLHHHGHPHKHRYTRHRSHLPSWMHFPGAVKLKDPAKGPKKEKFRLPWQKSLQKSFWQSFYSPERGNAHGHPEHPHAHHGPHPEHHQGAHHDHGHGHADHAGHGHGHGHHSVTDDLVAHPRVFVAEIVAVVFLSTIFETWEHWLRHRLAHQGRSSELRILDCLFKEVTCLGFIGLVLYLVHRLSIVDTLASKIFMPEELAHENPLFETFELVHMMIFLLLIVLLFQAAALLPLSHRIVEKWRRFERTTTWGQKKNSFESMLVQDGYLSRQARPSSPRGVELTCIKPFIYGSNWWERLMSRRNILVRMINWRMLRHEFLFPGSKDETPDPKRFKHAAHKGVSINPSFFSFEGYLRGLLSNTVVALVEVDMITWSLTLLVLIPLMYSCVVFSVSIEFLQCSIAWLLLASAAGLVICLEEDLYALTPELPEDARQILRLFSGTSIHDLQRALTPRGEHPCRDQILGAPGLGDADSSPKSNLRRPTDLLGSQAICTCETYRRLLRLVAFWQALCVTSLVVAFLSHPFARLSSVILHLLAWAEWPLMLFWIWPMLVRKLTMRYSLDETKDQGLIRAVSLHSKESLLRHHLRLVQVFCFYRRAAEMNEPWANVPCPSPVKSNEKRGGANEKSRNSGRRRSWAKAAFTKADAEEHFSHGKHLFQGMGDGEQEELWDLFELLDADGDESVDLNEIVGKFKAMGLKENPETAARGVLRLVEHSGNHAYAQRYLVEHGDMPSFTWETFSSMMALTTTHRPAREMEEDLSMIFRLIDKASPETVTVFEITEWMRGIKRSLTEADVASVLHKHFCEAKPTLTRAEFVEWFQAISGASDECEQHAGHGHGH